MMKDRGNPYEDILYLPHHKSKNHPQMPILDRAAQFSPFAALTGFEAAIEETGRLTDEQIELDETVKSELNLQLRKLKRLEKEHPEVEITYFVPDEKKDGGEYHVIFGCVKRIDEYEKVVNLTDEDGILVKILMENIVKIHAE